MLTSGLPMNRKEVFFTATVLPGIVCCKDFGRFDAFLHVLSFDSIAVDGRPETANIQFFTEYSLRDSAAPKSVKERFPVTARGNERPDLMILIDQPAKRSLIAIEAKMFSTVNPNGLMSQMEAQRKNILNPLGDYLKADAVHFALLPKKLIDAWKDDCPSELSALRDSLGNKKIVTWEEILAPYKDLGLASYWVAILEAALRDFSNLMSTTKSGKYKDGDFTGAYIVEKFGTDDFPYAMMGRFRGIDGIKLNRDIETGSWRTQQYEVKLATEDRQNWFPIGDFIRKIALHSPKS